MAAFTPHAFCALAHRLVAAGMSGGRVPRITVEECIAFVIAVFTLYGGGAGHVLFALLLLTFGIPVYVWQRRKLLTGRSEEVSYFPWCKHGV